MAKFRWTKDDGANWTVVEASLPYNISGVTASDTVIVEPIGDAVTDVAAAYEAEAVALFARMTTQPDVERKNVINTLIKALKTAGVWGKLATLHVFAAHDAQAANLNWISSSYTASAINNPTYLTDRHYETDGVSSYLDLLVKPNSGGILSLDSASFSLYLRNNTTYAGAVAGAYVSGNGTTITPRTTDNLVTYRVNSGALTTVTPVSGSTGLFCITRTSSTDVAAYRNGSLIESGVLASTTTVNTSFKIGTITVSSFSAVQVGAAHVGSGLSSDDNAALYSAINTYMTAVGANV